MSSIVRKFVLYTLIVASVYIASEANAQSSLWRNWSIEKTTWTSTDEKNYSAWIKVLGESSCNTVDKCLRGPANFLATEAERQSVNWDSDCGRFPYVLRSYFAWKNKLPFSYVSDVDAIDGSGDLRYSAKGNRPTKRSSFIQKNDTTPIDGVKSVKQAVDDIYTAMYRFPPETDITNNLYFDLYSVAITRDNIRPGTVVYDANGHVVVVYKVEDDGRIRYFDAHPDYSVSRGVYGKKFARSSPGMGAGFKNFRPITLTGATRSPSNSLIGGQITTLKNAALPGYSTEQFYGNKPGSTWKNGKFILNGVEMDYYDFVRTKLAVGDLKYHPINELTNAMDALCQDLRDRVEAVDGAITSGTNLKAQPANLPKNIYGTDGQWESFSTPSRDARLKVSFREIRTQVETFFKMYHEHNPRLDYQGNDLAGDMRTAYAKAAQACQITYKKSDGDIQQLSYDDAAERLFKMSFDPYHCVERRWGATDTTELNSCTDGSTKKAWYEAEQNLRNQLDRAYDVKMGFSLDQLQKGVPGSGTPTQVDIDLKGYLNRQ